MKSLAHTDLGVTHIADGVLGALINRMTQNFPDFEMTPKPRRIWIYK